MQTKRLTIATSLIIIKSFLWGFSDILGRDEQRKSRLGMRYELKPSPNQINRMSINMTTQILAQTSTTTIESVKAEATHLFKSTITKARLIIDLMTDDDKFSSMSVNEVASGMELIREQLFNLDSAFEDLATVASRQA
jgi:hypothetical protein